MKMRGVPGHIRADNGPEFIALAIRTWLKKAGSGTLFVEPGAPWENGYAESFHARLRDEFLNAEVFANLREAKALGEQWRREYNHERPRTRSGLSPRASSRPGWPPFRGSHNQHDQGTLIAGGTESGGIPQRYGVRQGSCRPKQVLGRLGPKAANPDWILRICDLI